MSEQVSNIGLLKRIEHQKGLSRELIEFGHFLLSKDQGLTNDAFLACLGCMNAFQDGRTAVDSSYLQTLMRDLTLNNFSSIKIDQELIKASIIGLPGEYNLFIYENGLLYVHTFFEYEVHLTEWIKEKAAITLDLNDDQQHIVDQIYPERHDDESDLQKSAVLLSLIKQLVFLTGGPGTGKTYTVQKMIELHRAVFGDGYKIRLAAPTGKAAQRINDTIAHLDDDNLKAQTIHRLLGATMGFGSFKYSQERLLPVDLLIVDEASMMDISLWMALINAMPPDAKLIIVGDNNQLASVEAGAVLNDICELSDNTFTEKIAKRIGVTEIAQEKPTLNDCIITLTKSKRFGDQTGIQALAEAIRTENAELAIELLEDDSLNDIRLMNYSSDQIQQLIDEYAIQPFFEGAEEVTLNDYSILCALKNGPLGSVRLNTQIERKLKNKLGVSVAKEWYQNRKVIITRNQHSINVQNGEIGIFNSATEHVQFVGSKVPVSRLQFFEPGYCITIHKSQGSEYKHVAILFPEAKNRVLSKELLYTGVTRAGLSVLIVGDRQLIKDTIQSPTLRNSGLQQKLWEL